MRKQSPAQRILTRVQHMVPPKSRVVYELSMDEKRSWGQGPWIDEPDQVWWTDPATQFPCAVIRNRYFGGVFCGYVGVPRSHVLHGCNYSSGIIPAFLSLVSGDEPNLELTPPGGVNYSNFITGVSEDFWFFGYDCGHSGDYMPKTEAFLNVLRDEYPELREMHNQIQNMKISLAPETSEETDFLDHLLNSHYWRIEQCIHACQALAQQLSFSSE